MDEKSKVQPDAPPPITQSVKARKESPLVQFTHKIGKSEIFDKDRNSKSSTSVASVTHGFHCGTCNATFTSSDAFLDHCNGRVHQRNLGLSLKVERVVEVDRVKARLQMLSQKRLATEQVIESKSTDHFVQQLDDANTEAEKQKQERKQRKKNKKSNSKPDPESEEQAEFLQAMGFNSFS